MSFLSPRDYVLIAFYFAVMLGIGIHFKRRASKNLDEYYLGGHRMPWWLLGFAGMSSWFDITGTMLITSFLFMIGPQALFIELRGGTGMVLAFMMVFMGKWHWRSHVMTKGEWMIYRFGKDRGAEAARIITAVGFIVFTVGMMGYLIQGTGTFLSMFLPFSPSVCALLTIMICIVYTALSGFYGVVWTDFVQSIIIIGGAITIAILGMNQVADLDSLNALATTVTGHEQWSQWTPTWHVDMPQGYERYDLLIVVASFFFLRNVLGGLDSGADPRYFGARNERECGMLSFLWQWLIMWRWPMMIGFAVLGLFMVQGMFPETATLVQASELIKQYHPEITKNIWHDVLTSIRLNADYLPALRGEMAGLLGTDWANKLMLLSFDGTVDPERIVPAVMLHALPAGLRGFLFVVFLAAGMSTFSSFVNAASPYFVKDLYHRYIRPTASNRELIWTSYLTTALIFILGYIMAYFAESINDIWGWLVMGLMSAVTLAGLLRFYWWRLNGAGVAWGTLAGIIFIVFQRIVWHDMSEVSSFIWVTGLTVGGSIITSLLTRPTEPEVLDYFYRTTRPFGFWGPQRRALDEEERVSIDRENRNDLIALPFAIAWQHLLYIILMLVVIKHWHGVLWSGVALALSMAGLYVFWWRKLPARTAIAYKPDRSGVPDIPVSTLEPIPVKEE